MNQSVRWTTLQRWLAPLVLFIISCSPAAQKQAGDAVPTASDQPKYGGVLRHAYPDDPPSWDLHQESTRAMQWVAWSAYNQLVIYDPLDPTKVIGDAAERWEEDPGGKFITFYLHKNMKFTNGTPLTSADVKFSVERVKDPPKGIRSPRKEALSPIERIETPDDYTVRVHFKRAYPAVWAALAQGWMAIYSKAFVEAKGHDIMAKEMMGSGAFKFKEYIRGTSIEMVKNPDYWQSGVPYLDGVMRYIIKDDGTRFAAFRTGQLDILDLSALEAEEIKKSMSDKITVQEGPSFGLNMVTMNTNRKPYDDLRVRQAVNLGTDRQAYIAAILMGRGQIAGTIPPSSAFALPKDELLKMPGYSTNKADEREKAKKLLAEAGYPNGFNTIVTFRSDSQDVAVFFQDQLKRIGIQSTLRPLDNAAVYDATEKRDFDIIPFGYGLATDDPDPLYSELYLCKALRNWSDFCDDKLDQLNQKQATTIDPAKRKEAVWELERYALPLGIKLTLGSGSFSDGRWNYVKNYMKHPGQYNMTHWRQVWLDR